MGASVRSDHARTSKQNPAGVRATHCRARSGVGGKRYVVAISANGSSNGIVWAHENAASGAAVLHAYAAGNLGNELYNSTQAANSRDSFGSGNKFITPTIADGKVLVGTVNGVAVFGLL